jgi:hypothetical protein
MVRTLQLLREARRWRFETAAFDMQIRPLDKGYRVWHRHCEELWKRDPELSAAVCRTIHLDFLKEIKLTKAQWRVQAHENVRRMQKIREAGRRRRSGA